jgi:hypothetical protein
MRKGNKKRLIPQMHGRIEENKGNRYWGGSIHFEMIAASW